MALPDDRLERILVNQGYRELVSAYLFAGGLPLAPTLDDKCMLADHAREELAHFEKVSLAYEQLTHKPLLDTVSGRASAVRAPQTWLEAAVAGFLFDRAAAAQLAEYKRLSDPRLDRFVDSIREHEHEHALAAETALLDLVRQRKDLTGEVRAHVERWFGIAAGALDEPAERSGARGAFLKAIRGPLDACGLGELDLDRLP